MLFFFFFKVTAPTEIYTLSPHDALPIWTANVYSQDKLREIFRQAGFDAITFRRFPWPFWHLNLWGLIVEARTHRS